jgi:RNA polymerase sigma-70 factor (ECF subfamily)
MFTSVCTSEAVLVSGLKAQNSKSFEYLIKNYSYSMKSVIAHYLKNELDQEDILQEVWLKIYKGIHRYNDQKAGLYCWMATIARNLCIDFLRKEKRLQKESLEDTFVSNSYDHATRQQEEHIGVEELVNEAKDLDMPVARLFFFQGYSHKEISEELNIPVGTSKSRLRSGLKSIRRYTGEFTGISQRA